MSIPYWPETLPQYPARGLDHSPQDVSASFEAAVGEPIGRPRTTGAPFIMDAQWAFKGTQIATFEAFFSTLGQGNQRFAMRDITGQLRMWKFLGPYRRQFPLKTLARVQAKLMLLPGVPWFSPYGRDGYSTVPAFVADYDAGVYGIDGLRKTAADLPDIEGTYLVRRTTTTLITQGQETLSAGDITEAQPTGTLNIVGFSL